MMEQPNSKPEADENDFLDVSREETQYVIQCEDVRLVSSIFRPLTKEDEKPETSGFAFKIRVFVNAEQAIGHLETQVNFITEEAKTEFGGYFLRFGLVANFVANQPLASQEMGDFARLYTLTILWPYAREYASDQLRRAGGKFEALPIINPQVVTEELINDNLVEVFLEDEADDQPGSA